MSLSNQTLGKMVLTCLLVIYTPPQSNQVFCPVDDGGVGDAGNERMRDKRQARELEHSHGEEKETEGARDEKGARDRVDKGQAKRNLPCPTLRVLGGTLLLPERC